jgi:hypothetical protein
MRSESTEVEKEEKTSSTVIFTFDSGFFVGVDENAT